MTVSNATFTGANRAGGSFTGGTGNVGPASGVVLSSGFVQTYPPDFPNPGDPGDDPCSRGVEGPNNCNEDPSAPDGSDNTAALGTAGDSALDAIVSPNLTEDATILEFDFIPTQGTVDFSYVFSSEEYNDFANSAFNDVFAFFVNGTNCALVPGTSDPVSINTINNGDPEGDPDPPQRPSVSRQRPPNAGVDRLPDGRVDDGSHLSRDGQRRSDQPHQAGDRRRKRRCARFSGIHPGRQPRQRQPAHRVQEPARAAAQSRARRPGSIAASTCSATFVSPTMVSLTPTPDATSTFAGWSGACTVLPSPAS